jgi:hypothetical protein
MIKLTCCILVIGRPWFGFLHSPVIATMYHSPSHNGLPTQHCKTIPYFRWDFILRFCNIVSLQQSKIHVFGRVAIENPLNIFIFAGFIFAIITPT